MSIAANHETEKRTMRPTTTVTEKTQPWIFRCKKCKAAKRFDRPIKISVREGEMNGRFFRNVSERFMDEHSQEMFEATQCCGRFMTGGRVNGRTTGHVCDVRCTSAKGHNCECSCGGANHGSDHA